MSNKKKYKKNTNFPCPDEIKIARKEFKKMIDEMPDEEFVTFSCLFVEFMDSLDENLDEEDWDYDDYEEWEDEAEEFYNNEKNNVIDFPLSDDEDLPF